jgi:hypothetical protein
VAGDGPVEEGGHARSGSASDENRLARRWLRCALGDSDQVEAVLRAGSWKGSQLWKTISTTKGPLRLPWTDVVTWARADHDRAS